MSLSISAASTNLFTQATSSAQGPQGAGGPPPGPPPSGGPPSHEEAINTLGESLDEETRETLLSAVEEMEAEGASFEEIRDYVTGELEANGIEAPGKGVLVNTVA